jgi:hypothetical protein
MDLQIEEGGRSMTGVEQEEWISKRGNISAIYGDFSFSSFVKFIIAKFRKVIISLPSYITNQLSVC